MAANLNISVVVPVYNESESLPELVSWINRVMQSHNFSYELIFVDDGSTDDSWEVIKRLQQSLLGSHIKAIQFRRNYGKSPALYIGFDRAQGDVIITMDADLQDSPDEIPALYNKIMVEKYDLVSGWKQKRHDPLSKRLPSKLFNATARFVSGIKLHDFNCGLKAYRKKVIKSIEVYGEMHRYIPILAKKAGFKHIGEHVVEHFPRKYGESKYGWERMLKGYIDLLSVMFTTRYGKRPMYLFSTLGTLLFIMGGIISIVLICWKLSLQSQGLPARSVTDQPLFYIALTNVIIGSQMFLAGFLGEMINRNSIVRNNYLIDEELCRPWSEGVE